MEKQKRWQFYLILAVLLLTLYNILPTVFYYTKPLGAPIDAPRAEHVAHEALARVNSLEDGTKAWLESFTKLLGVHPTSVSLREDSPGLVELAFSNEQDAQKFRLFLPRAGALIPFTPSQLELYQGVAEEPEKVLVSRQIKVHLNPDDSKELFQFTSKQDADGLITPQYRHLVYDRVTQLALAFAGPSNTAQQLVAATQDKKESADDLTIALAKEIVEVDALLSKTDSAVVKRYFATLTQGAGKDSDALIQKFQSGLSTLKTRVESQRTSLVEEQKKLKAEGVSLETSQEQLLALYDSQIRSLDAAGKVIRKNLTTIKTAKDPLTSTSIEAALAKGKPSERAVQTLSMEGRNPFIESLNINWENDTVEVHFYADVQQIRQGDNGSEAASYQREKLGQLIINDIARASRLADETISPDESTFSVALSSLIESRSFLALDLGQLAKKQAQQEKPGQQEKLEEQGQPGRP
ncbi:MAG: protein translocase subunit SecDF, partial [Parachlamydiaceae bacterium]